MLLQKGIKIPAHESSDILSDGLENKLLPSDGEDEVHTVTEESVGEFGSVLKLGIDHTIFSSYIKHVNMPTALTSIKVSQEIFFLQTNFARRKTFLPCLTAKPI